MAFSKEFQWFIPVVTSYKMVTGASITRFCLCLRMVLAKKQAASCGSRIQRLTSHR